MELLYLLYRAKIETERKHGHGFGFKQGMLAPQKVKLYHQLSAPSTLSTLTYCTVNLKQAVLDQNQKGSKGYQPFIQYTLFTVVVWEVFLFLQNLHRENDKEHPSWLRLFRPSTRNIPTSICLYRPIVINRWQ